jgi:hypothetical protein
VDAETVEANVKEEIKALFEGFIGAVVLAVQEADLTAGKGTEAAAAPPRRREPPWLWSLIQRRPLLQDRLTTRT